MKSVFSGRWRGGFACRIIFFLALALVRTNGAALELISQRDPGQPAPSGGDSDSMGAVPTPDGRFVLFCSSANNLVATANGTPLPILNPPKLNVFLRDRTNGLITLVSVNLAGTGGGNGDSVPVGISTNGRYACFESGASDLIAGDTNGVTDVFLRDLWSNTTALVSIALDGVSSGNGVCRSATMTPDGRFVSFVSAATNLVAGDTNRIPDVFVRDLQLGLTTLVSVGASSTNLSSSVSSSSEAPDMTPDGRYIAFYSTATNLVAGVKSVGDIYVRDTVAGTTTWASADGRALFGTTNAFSFNHAISADGQFIAYEVATNQLSTRDFGRGIILRFNTASATTDVVNTNAYVPRENAEDARTLDLTPDGRYVAFVGNTNTAGTCACVFLWDGQSGAMTLVSSDLAGAVSSNSISLWPTVDPSGQFVAFLSDATNLMSNARGGNYHLYLRDLQSGTTTLLDADDTGSGAAVSPAGGVRLGVNAQWAVFDSHDTSLVPNDRNRAYDVMLRDVVDGTNELISSREAALPATVPNGSSTIFSGAISSDSRFVVFTSSADNLVANQTNHYQDVFVRDRLLATNTLVSVATNGLAANGNCSEASISGNGQFVVFTSSADNQVGNDTNRALDVFVRDLQAGTTTVASVSTTGVSANRDCYSPVISADGRYVLFRSSANNLAAGSFSGENLFLRDLGSATTYALTTGGVGTSTMTLDGRFIAFTPSTGNVYVWDTQANGKVYTNVSPATAHPHVAMSSDGRWVVYDASGTLYAADRLANTSYPIGPAGITVATNKSGLRFSAGNRFLTYSALPAGTTYRVFVYDFETASNLVITANGGAAANDLSDSPDITADGRFVVYCSMATNLTGNSDSNSVPDLFLYDRTTGSNTLLTSSTFTGAAASDRSLTPQLSTDGRVLVFESWASDLTRQGGSRSGNVFALSFFYLSLTPGSPGQGPTLKWLTAPGASYRVQFKDHLSDSDWQDVTGAIINNGYEASVTDLAPGVEQRFYRVVAF